MPAHDNELSALQQREIEALIEAIPKAIVVIDPDTVRYIAVNAAACQLVGRSRDEMMAVGPALVAADASITEEIRKSRYAQLIASYPERRTQETANLRVDGSVSLVRQHRQAVRLGQRWVIVIQVDELGEAIPQWSDASFRNVVELSSDAVGIVDVRLMQLIEVNRAATDLLEYSREELLEHGLAIGLTGDSTQDLRALFTRLIEQSPRARVTESELRRRDGSQVPVQITQQAVNDHGRWVVILTARDITERVQARRALEQRVHDLARSNEELERFAYIASHDLMEPLRMMASYTQLLERRYRPQLDADAGEFMDFIVSGAKRMKQLLDDLLAYSRVGRMRGRLAAVPVNEVLDDVIANLKVLIDEKGALIERGELPVVQYSRTEVTQLLQNLVGNALKFQDGSRTAEVRIDATDDGQAWTFSVADNGVGIAPEYFERIFVIFQRLHGRDSYSGTGIGLAICKKIVEQHGGRIWVESQPGVGSTFRFTVPHQPAGAAP